jgi:hypothetical protein
MFVTTPGYVFGSHRASATLRPCWYESPAGGLVFVESLSAVVSPAQTRQLLLAGCSMYFAERGRMLIFRNSFHDWRVIICGSVPDRGSVVASVSGFDRDSVDGEAELNLLLRQWKWLGSHETVPGGSCLEVRFNSQCFVVPPCPRCGCRHTLLAERLEDPAEPPGGRCCDCSCHQPPTQWPMPYVQAVR